MRISALWMPASSKSVRDTSSRRCGPRVAFCWVMSAPFSASPDGIKRSLIGAEAYPSRGTPVNRVHFPRRSASDRIVLVACNFTPVPRQNYKVGVPRKGYWREILNSDAKEYGGSGWGNMGGVEAAPIPSHGRPFSLTLTLPPLSAVYLKSETE